MENAVKDAHKRVVVVNSPGGCLKRLFWAALIVIVLLGFAGAGVVGYYTYKWKADLPSAFQTIDDYHPVLGSKVVTADGQLLADFSIEKREIVPFEQIPKRVMQAFIAAEDANFFDHYGFDPWYFMRAMGKNMAARRFKEGASTITMQLARTFFLSREKKIERKAKEILLSVFVLEKNLSKRDILYLYLNQIYLGHGAYGIGQAAHTYFDKNIQDLSLGEIAVLAGLPKAPGRDSPFVNMARATERREYVLRRMQEEGYISKEEMQEALSQPIQLHEAPDPFLATAPDYSEHLRKYVYNKYGEETLYKGGLLIEGAVDLRAQRDAMGAVFYGLRQMDRREGYRGPSAELTDKAQIDAFLANAKAEYGDTLDRTHFYWGVVTAASEKQATVRVADHSGTIPLESIRWARKPNPAVGPDSQPLRKVSDALKVGDVILVRPTDSKGIKDRLDFRSHEPVDANGLLWDLWEDPLAQSAIFSKDPATGYVKAMVGGLDYEKSEFNRAVQACRQPGSAFKPIVYTAAIDSDWNVSTIILDAPIVAGEWNEQWKPDNFNQDFKGEVSLRYALQNSLNIPAIKTIEHVGVPKVKEYAQKMGIRTAIQDDPSIALGSACVTPEDLANVYAHFANYGKAPRTVFLKVLIDSTGKVLEDNRHYTDPTLGTAAIASRMEAEALNPPAQVLPEDTGYIMNWLLMQVVQGGTGSGASALGRPCAGKTGTTNDSYDAWFSGYTPDLVTVAWIGHDDNARPLGPNETGGHAALPIWLDYMQAYLKDKPVRTFPPAQGITWQTVDMLTGKKAAGGDHVISAPFKPGTGPEESMTAAGEVSPDTFFKQGDVY